MADASQLYNEGEKLKDAGDFQAAAEKFEAAIEADESYALAHFGLAVVYWRLGRFDDSVRHGERAAELDPNDPFSYTALSVTYQRAFQGTQDHRYIQLAEDAMARAHMLQSRQ